MLMFRRRVNETLILKSKTGNEAIIQISEIYKNSVLLSIKSFRGEYNVIKVTESTSLKDGDLSITINLAKHEKDKIVLGFKDDSKSFTITRFEKINCS